MIRANVHEAKSQLSKLIERAEAGEEVVIARNGKPAVRLVPVRDSQPAKRDILGALRDRIRSGGEAANADADREVARAFGVGPNPGPGPGPGSGPGSGDDPAA